MKSYKYLFLAVILVSSFQFTQAQKKKKNKKVAETEFQVSGICGMCEERIENALSVKGVKMASWDLESKTCKVVYQPSKVSLEQLHELVNEVGHDTDQSKASDEDYANVHGCCKYRTMGDCE